MTQPRVGRVGQMLVSTALLANATKKFNLNRAKNIINKPDLESYIIKNFWERKLILFMK